MARARGTRTFSAGGVVFRINPAVPAAHASGADPLASIEVALVGRTQAGIWVLPKGTPRPDEPVEDTALREVREETGLITRIVGRVGSIHYSFSREGRRFHKEVYHFLLEAVGGDVSLHDSEYDEARWFPLADAERRLTFANEADLIRRARPLILRLLRDRAAAAAPQGGAAT